MGTNLEYITERSFNSSFKNMLSDYYTYGFKDRNDYSGSMGTYNNNYKRLNDFLQDYMEWSEQKIRKTKSTPGKNVTFITCDSQAMNINPFHRVYHFCGTGIPAYLYSLFHVLVALDSTFQLRANKDSIDDLSWDRYSRLFESSLMAMGVDKSKITSLLMSGNSNELLKKAKANNLSKEQIEKIQNVIQYASRYTTLKTSELEKYCSQASEKFEDGKQRKRVQGTINRTMNNRLERLRDIGVIQCKQKAVDYIFTHEQIAHFLEAIPENIITHLKSKGMLVTLENALENNSLNKAGDRNWYLSGLTLNSIIKSGKKESDCFENHFRYALDFYSKTFLFGEIGMYLLDRLGGNYTSPIRIKHEYYMHSLNDFNAIDLMAAIENNEWCLISYKRENVETKLLCYPIELRISSTTGREYLMYYEPFKKSCSALRLEFIDTICCYCDQKVKRCLAEYFPNVDVEIDIERNLNRAKLLLDYTWGVSTGSTQERNIENLSVIFQEVCIRISYNKDTDYYILNRLYRESRIGMFFVNEEEGYIDFSVIAADINEIIPFIRSLYSRVLRCSGYNEQGFSIEMDIENIVGQVLKNKFQISDNNKPDVAPWYVDENFFLKLGNGIEAHEHEKLFNEIFSTHYRVFATILGEICHGSQSYTESELKTLCKEIMNRFKHEFGPEIRWSAFKEGEIFFDLLKDGGFLIPESGTKGSRFESKYFTASTINIYRDVLPLSEIEVRWLKTIVEDEKIHYFLKEKEILAVKLILADLAVDIKPFPMSIVNYFDQYKFSAKKEWKESRVIIPILNAISNSHVIKIKYVSSKKKVVSNNYKPILIEYSKKDNCFKGYFLSCRKKEGLKVYNLAQCVSIEDTEERFDSTELRTSFDTYRKQQMDKVEIEFEDKPKLADRILTEFSPWKKCCQFDSESGIYHLTIYYQKQDAKEMALRLLGLGGHIRLLDPNHRLSIIVRSRLRDQIERIPKENVRSGDNTR